MRRGMLVECGYMQDRADNELFLVLLVFFVRGQAG